MTLLVQEYFGGADISTIILARKTCQLVSLKWRARFKFVGARAVPVYFQELDKDKRTE